MSSKNRFFSHIPWLGFFLANYQAALPFMQGIGELAKYNSHLCEFTLTDIVACCIDDRFSTVFIAGISDALGSLKAKNSGVAPQVFKIGFVDEIVVVFVENLQLSGSEVGIWKFLLR